MQMTEPRLLIADDDRDFRESLAEVFDRRGFSTHLAADGQEAIEFVLGSGGFHLVILDVHMPRLTGLEALGQIRQAAISLPCILMSALLDEQIVEQASALKTADMLAKPFTLRDLTHKVERVLTDSYGWASPAQRQSEFRSDTNQDRI
jgi:CheY-like chemotaxis protein